MTMTSTTLDRVASSEAPAVRANVSHRLRAVAKSLWNALESIGRHRAASQMRAHARWLEDAQPETAKRLRDASNELLNG
jgi:hypothetical protein